MINLLGILVDGDQLTAESAERAHRLADKTRTPVSAILTRLGLVSEQALAHVLSEQRALPLLQRSALVPDPAMPADLNPDFLLSRKLLPIRSDAGEVVLAMANPLDNSALAGTSFVYGQTCRPPWRLNPISTMPSERFPARQRLSCQTSCQVEALCATARIKLACLAHAASGDQLVHNDDHRRDQQDVQQAARSE